MTNTNFLDDRAGIASLDGSHVLETIEQLANQCQEVWAVAQKIEVPSHYANVKQVVIAGMGGSSLGTHIIQGVFKEELKVPVLIVPDYSMPAYVNENTLVIASSYSGTTEETIAAVTDARAKGALIAGITSGGPLAELLAQWHVPALVFPTTYNPSTQPRMGLGYSVFGQIVLFSKCGLLPITQKEYDSVIETIAQAHLRFSQPVPSDSNPAKVLAFEMLDRIPVITVAEHLEGVGHVFANQLNENAKNYSEYRVIPEMNHHLMEGLQFPKSNADNLLLFTVESTLYSQQNQTRMHLTTEVAEKQHIQSRSLTLEAQSQLEQAFELLVFSSYVSFYLAMLHNIDPSAIPWVDWFKAQLKK